jgi:hypothetical protein
MSPDKTNTSSSPTLKVSRQQVVDEARKWLGTRWVHQGRSSSGIDCAGLLIRVMGDLGLPVRDMTGYRRTPDAMTFLNHIRDQTDLAEIIKPGSIALFRQSAFPCHTGFFTEKHGILHIIHSYIGVTKVIEEPFAHQWPDQLVEARDIIGITE